jgi:TonB family protein
MYWAIWRAWMNRLFVTLPAFDRWSFQKRVSDLKGSVLIRFVIERNGSVSSIQILEPSIMPPLDESAAAALKEVILPRLPEDFPKDAEGVTGRFTMDIENEAGWKEYMKYQKFKGIF